QGPRRLPGQATGRDPGLAGHDRVPDVEAGLDQRVCALTGGHDGDDVLPGSGGADRVRRPVLGRLPPGPARLAVADVPDRGVLRDARFGQTGSDTGPDHYAATEARPSAPALISPWWAGVASPRAA